MKQSGVTLITLVITIVVISILTGAGISIGIDSIKSARVTAFNAELKMIHARVNELVEEYGLTELNQLGEAIPNDKLSAVQTALGTNDTTGYRYFNKASLEAIDIVNVDREVVINFSTRDVADINGVELEGEMIYDTLDWTNEEYINRNGSSQKPTFSLEKKVYGLNATIFVKNINYGGNTDKGTVNYCKMENESEGTWKISPSTEIPINVSGTYKVKVTNSAGVESADSNNTIEVTLTNKPKLDSGMTPVVYVEGENDEPGYWKVVDEDSGDWYDYSSDKAQWANVMLQDGLAVDSTGKVTTMGSMFVWIPRYMYQIPAANYHTNTAGEINIKFLKGTTNLPTDDTNITIANASGGDNWNVHPAFCDGNKTDYTNGEWDKDITGIWVAKFEASSSNPSTTSGGGNTVELDVKILPNVTSWRAISTDNAFNVCKKMNKNENIYSLSNGADTHLMKNSEWGMTVYLTQSKYGQGKYYVQNQKSQRVWDNPTGSSYITGRSKDPSGSDSTIYTYNTDNGAKASTTWNIYGIYDMSKGTWEKTAAYLQNETGTKNISDAEAKYVNEYKCSNTPTDRHANYELAKEKYGDAIYETSETSVTGSNAENATSWQRCLFYVLH